MWSAWTEVIDIYLGFGVSLVRVPGAPARGVEGLASRRPQDMLASIVQVLGGTSPLDLKGRRLRFSLGASVCPPIAFAVPEGLRGLAEYEALARAEAAKSLGGDVADVACEVDAQRPGLCAAMPVSLVRAIEAWARSAGAKVHSIRPMWSIATDCAVAAATPRGICVFEPESRCLILEEHDRFHVEMAFGLADDGLPLPQDAARLRFTIEPQTASDRGPAIWRGHWGIE